MKVLCEFVENKDLNFCFVDGFIVTDIDGMSKVSEETLKRLSILHDVMFFNVSDAYLAGSSGFDIESSSYLPDFILEDKKLQKLEFDLKNKLYEETEAKFKKYRVMWETFDSQKHIAFDIIKLLERRKNANKY